MADCRPTHPRHRELGPLLTRPGDRVYTNVMPTATPDPPKKKRKIPRGFDIVGLLEAVSEATNPKQSLFHLTDDTVACVHNALLLAKSERADLPSLGFLRCTSSTGIPPDRYFLAERGVLVVKGRLFGERGETTQPDTEIIVEKLLRQVCPAYIPHTRWRKCKVGEEVATIGNLALFDTVQVCIARELSRMDALVMERTTTVNSMPRRMGRI